MMPFGNVAVPAIQVTVALPAAPITMPIVCVVMPVIPVVRVVVPVVPVFVLAASPDATNAKGSGRHSIKVTRTGVGGRIVAARIRPIVVPSAPTKRNRCDHNDGQAVTHTHSLRPGFLARPPGAGRTTGLPKRGCFMMIASAKRSRPRHPCERVLEATLAIDLGPRRSYAYGEAQAVAERQAGKGVIPPKRGPAGAVPVAIAEATG